MDAIVSRLSFPFKWLQAVVDPGQQNAGCVGRELTEPESGSQDLSSQQATGSKVRGTIPHIHPWLQVGNLYQD